MPSPFFLRHHKYERKISVKKYYTKIFYLICSADSHVCGKKLCVDLPYVAQIGLLPLAWEKVIFGAFFVYVGRNTPTHVGKRFSIYGQKERFEFILSWNFLQTTPLVLPFSFLFAKYVCFI